MSGENVTKIGSDIKVASDNEIAIKNSLINFDIDFSGLKDAVAMFFPSIRHEMILRYRAETVAKIGIEAYRMAINDGIQINPIPPKIAMHLIERMSLEHEPDMYKKWASLLIAAGVNPDPIQQQFSDILANLNAHSANLLKEIYTEQHNPDYENEYDEYVDKLRFLELYKIAKSKAIEENDGVGEYSIGMLSYMRNNSEINYNFPLIISGTEEKTIFVMVDEDVLPLKRGSIILNMNPSEGNNDCCLVLNKEEKNMLIGLENLRLIKYQEFRSKDIKKTKEGKAIYINHYGLLLTKFGYSFVDCLEHPTKEPMVLK